MIEEREFTIDTPVGTIKSDSGNHFVDIISVMGVIVFIYIGKVLMKEIIRRINA